MTNVIISFEHDGLQYDVEAHDFTMRQSGPSYDGLSVQCDGKVIYSTGIGMPQLDKTTLAVIDDQLVRAWRNS